VPERLALVPLESRHRRAIRPLELALNDYKFGGDRSWAPVFGRMLAGFLMRERPVVSRLDLVVASPTFLGEGGRHFDHARSILPAATGSLPGDGHRTVGWAPVPAIIRTGPTP
jgi:hypothetical protein